MCGTVETPPAMHAPSTLPNPSVLPHLYQPRIFALLGICAYLVGFVLPLPWHLPVIILALMSALAVLSGSRHRAQVWSPLTIAVAVFLASVGLSTKRDLQLFHPVVSRIHPMGGHRPMAYT